MALVKYGGGITAMSGSIAGNTFARNRYGNYIRSRTKPVNPNSTGQAKMRSIVGELTQAWRTALSAGQRTAWTTYANSVAMKNKLGETTYLSGFNHFIRGNAVFKQTNGIYKLPGPTVLALPEKDPSLVITGSVATQQLTVTYDGALPWKSENGALMQIEQGEPQNPTRNYFGGPWKYAGQILWTDANPMAINAPYSLTLGQKVWCYARILRSDARLSEPMVVSLIVGA